MKIDWFGVIWGLLFGTIAAVLSVWYFYLSWYKPEVLREKAVSSVKSWWPFADFYRSYFGSTFYLWLVRLGTAAVLTILLGLGIINVLGIAGTVK